MAVLSRTERDGSSPESIRTDWDTNPPTEIWRRTIGPGFSSLAITDGRIFTQERRRIDGSEREFAVCFDAANGDELWAINLDRAQYTDLAGYDDRMDGPRSTPTIDGGFAYFATSYLRMYCLRVEDGSEVWMRDFQSEIGGGNIPWENCASPLIVGDLVLLNGNASDSRLMAVDKATGETVWSNPDDLESRDRADTLTHATPTFATIEGVPQVVFLTRSGLISVAPETGENLWYLGFSPSPTSAAATPLVVGNNVHASVAYSSGMWVANITRSGDTFSATEIYRERGNSYQMHWSSPVKHDGFIYGIPSPRSSQGRLACLDLTTGENRWTQTTVGSDQIGFGSLIKAANSLIVLTEEGELVLVEPNPEAYTETAKFKILDEYCWNSPSLSNGRLYARSTSPTNPELVVFDVSDGTAVELPAVSIDAGWSVGGQSIRIVVRADDGSNLDEAHRDLIEIISTPDLNASRETWINVAADFQVVDGSLAVDLPITVEPTRYFQTRRKDAP